MLIIRCATDVLLENTRVAVIEGAQEWDLQWHLVASACFVLCLQAVIVLIVSCGRQGSRTDVHCRYKKSAPKTRSDDGGDQRHVFRLQQQSTRFLVWSIVGGFFGSCVDHFRFRCFLVLGMVRLHVLSLGVVLLRVSIVCLNGRGGTNTSAVCCWCLSLSASLLAFGQIAIWMADYWWLDSVHAEAEYETMLRLACCLGLVVYLMMQWLVDDIRAKVFRESVERLCGKTSVHINDSTHIVALPWFLGLAIGHVVFYLSNQQLDVGSITYRILSCVDAPAQICLVGLQALLWLVVVPRYGMMLDEKSRTSPICALVVAIVACGTSHHHFLAMTFLEVLVGLYTILAALVCSCLLPGSHLIAQEGGFGKPCSDDAGLGSLTSAPTWIRVGALAWCASALWLLGASSTTWLCLGLFVGMLVFLATNQCLQQHLVWNGSTAVPATAVEPAPTGQAPVAMCAVCLENAADFVAVPCGHRSLCGQCRARLHLRSRKSSKSSNERLECVICRAKVRQFVRLYE